MTLIGAAIYLNGYVFVTFNNKNINFIFKRYTLKQTLYIREITIFPRDM
jgi:hypothetical protein